MAQSLRNLLASLIVGCPLAVSAAELTNDTFAPGHAAAQRFGPIQGAVAVRPLDNSPRNLELAARLADALRRRGIAVADDAPLLLEFETLTTADTSTARQGGLDAPHRFDFGLGPGIEPPSGAAELLPREKRRSPQSAYSVRYTLRATVSNRDGRRLWEGYTDYGEVVNDETQIYATMASLLAGMVGDNADGRFTAD